MRMTEQQACRTTGLFSLPIGRERKYVILLEE
jgi:hypothetical protein